LRDKIDSAQQQVARLQAERDEAIREAADTSARLDLAVQRLGWLGIDLAEPDQVADAGR
jgi:hypothetical protein